MAKREGPTKRVKYKGREIWSCCVCGEFFEGWGNNPWPLSDREDDECCNECNMEVVMARFKLAEKV